MTSPIKTGHRVLAIAITIVLIIVCFVISLKDYKKPAQLPKAPPSIQTYVNNHLLVRTNTIILGSDILGWANGQAKGICSVLNEHYTPIIEGSDNINGADCLSVRLKPNLKLRPWIQFWIDKKTGNTYSAREWSAENSAKPVGIRVNSTQLSPGLFLNQVTDKRILRELPEGYHLQGYISPDPAIRHYVYSDGLQVVSIFVGQINAFPKIQPKVVMEQNNTRVYAYNNNGCLILCMADLPASVLIRWAQNFSSNSSLL